MFGLLNKAKPVSETDVIKNAILDAFLDNCLGIPSVKVGGDDDSISFTVRHFGPYGRIYVSVERSFNMWPSELRFRIRPESIESATQILRRQPLARKSGGLSLSTCTMG